MSGKSGAGYRVDWADQAADTGPHRPMALSHAECHRLLVNWASVELGEIGKVGFAGWSAGYQDYVPPRDPETRQDQEIRRAERVWADIDRAGWCVLTMLSAESTPTMRVHGDAIMRAYRGRSGKPVSNGAKRLALEAFGRVWVTWSEAVDGPLNSL